MVQLSYLCITTGKIIALTIGTFVGKMMSLSCNTLSRSQESKSMPWAAMLKLKLNLWRPTRPSRTNTPKRCPFHYKGQECKSGSQETPGITGKFGLGVQSEAGHGLIVSPRECTGYNKHPLPTTQKTLHTDTSWSIPKSDCEKRIKKQRRKGKIYPFECRVPKNSKEREESLPQWSKRGKQ